MNKLMLWSERHPIAVVSIIVVSIVLSVFKIKDLHIDASTEALMIKGDAAYNYYLETLDRFGSDNILVIYVQDNDLFTPQKLKQLWNLQGELESELEKIVDKGAKVNATGSKPPAGPGTDNDLAELEAAPGERNENSVDDQFALLEAELDATEEFEAAFPQPEKRVITRVESLFTVTNFKGVDGSLTTNPLLDYPPETVEKALQVKADALRSALLVRNLIAPDGSATAINLYVNSDWGDRDFPTKFSRKVDEILSKYTKDFDNLFQIGIMYIKRCIAEYTLTDEVTLIPVSVIVMLLMLVVSMRSVNGAILPMITAGLSILLTAGFMGWMGIPLNMLTVIVPSLIMVIGSTEDIHLLCEYVEGVEHSGGLKAQAIKYMINKCGMAVALTALTTFLGFSSIIANKIMILKQFGMAAAFGLFVNPIITCMIIPVYLKIFGSTKVQPGSGGQQKGVIGRLIHGLADSIIKVLHWKKWAVLSFILGGTILLGAFSLNIKVDNDVVGYFKPDSTPRVRFNVMSEKIAGAQTFFIRISSGHPGTFKQPQALKALEAIQNYVKQQGWFDKTHSLADNIALIHQEMNNASPDFFKVPDSADLIAQYLIFLQRDEISRYVTSDYSEANILVRHNITSSYELKKVFKQLDRFCTEKLNPHFIYGFTGENVLIRNASDSMVNGQAESLSFLLVVIFIIMSFLFVNIKAGALSLVPNIFPIVLFFGVMGVMGIPLNIGTAMVAAVAIGIAVDDTIHFMVRYNKEMRELQDQQKAMEVCIHAEIKPVICTSMSLALGFLVLGLANFVPVIYFGLLSAMVMILALIGDLILTPILLSSTQLITLLDMIGLKISDAVIKDSELFALLKPNQIKKVILLGKIQEKAADALVIKAGDHGESMFLILEGRVQVLIHDEQTGKEMALAELGPGEVFGEIALVDPGPRSADVMAVEPLKYLEFNWGKLRRIQRIFPRIAVQLFHNLSIILGHRLVRSNKLLMEINRR